MEHGLHARVFTRSSKGLFATAPAQAFARSKKHLSPSLPSTEKCSSLKGALEGVVASNWVLPHVFGWNEKGVSRPPLVFESTQRRWHNPNIN